MSGLPHAESFRDLIVYQKARSLAAEIFQVSRSFPEEELFSLVSQIRRSSRSIGAQIAESWGKRRYERHFVSKLTDTDSEQYETQHWLEIAKDNGYLDPHEAAALCGKCGEIGRLLNSMIAKSGSFCRSS